MTEEEAAKRWCPFARDLQSHGGNRLAYGVYRSEADPDSLGQFSAEMADMHPCIGSFCMAWRARTGDDGHCGLAGKP